MATITGRHYSTRQPLRLAWEGERITACTVLTGPEAAGTEDWPLLAPALCDVQINGYAGLDFSVVEHVGRIAATLAAFGVARFCPTVCTGSDARMGQALRCIARACAESAAVDAAAPLIHIEGPYMSPAEGARGAHPPEHMKPPTWEHFCRLQDWAGGRIGLVTIAPESEGATRFVARCAAEGIRVALGHTAADAATIRAAVDAGATMSTHLGNGLATPMDRHHNPVWPQLADQRLVAGFIADGEHLPAEALIAMVRAKGGVEGSVLVSDSVAEAGLPPGHYPGVGGQGVDVLPSGRIQLAGTPYLAGSGAHLAHCVAHAVHCGAATWPEAIDMASTRAALAVGREPGGLRVGAPADLMRFRIGEAGDLVADLTVRAGVVVHGRLGAGATTPPTGRAAATPPST